MATNAIKLSTINDTTKHVYINYPDTTTFSNINYEFAVNGAVLAKNKMYVSSGSLSPFICFVNNDTWTIPATDTVEERMASIYAAWTNSTDKVMKNFIFRQFSHNNTNKHIATYEDYVLPEIGTNLASSASYKILTTKSVALSSAELTRVQSMLGITPVDTSIFVQLSGAQTITGKKLFQNDTTYPGIRISGSNVTNYGSTTYGPAYLGLNFGSSSNPFFRIEFTEYSHRAGNVNSFLSVAEVYRLPEVTPGLTGNNKSYLILTEKTPVTVAQGGTGATTLDGAGIITKTGEQIISGSKYLNLPSIYNDSTGNAALYFYRNSAHAATDETGIIVASTQTINSKKSMKQFTFGQYSYSSSTGDQLTYRENYVLPDVTADISSNSTYQILTSKTPVALVQGGTGATTAAAARSNLGIDATSLYSGTFTSGSSNATLTNAKNYKVLLLIGYVESNQVRCSALVPINILSSTDIGWNIANEVSFISVNLSTSGNNVIMKYRDRHDGNCAITNVYGIN